MKILKISVLFLTLSFLFSGCSLIPGLKSSSDNSSSSNSSDMEKWVTRGEVNRNGKLTQSKAQNTMNRWVTRGEVKVLGVQEIPQENAAKVDLNFTNFTFKVIGGTEKTYSGNATAIFTHYNDGRWVLTHVSTSQGWNSMQWNNLNVEAN